MEILRTEYPRPQFQRDAWLNLNGEWEFAFDDEQVGLKEQWYVSGEFPMRIRVPFCFESKLSGIGDTSMHDVVWYRRAISIPDHFKGKRVLLHFGAVDYEAQVWVNGGLVATHEGGHTPFCADITDVLKRRGDNTIVVRARDFSKDRTLPRGKQYWKEKSESIFYTRTTGIWQTVWLEAVAAEHLVSVRMTPDIDTGEVQIRFFLSEAAVAAKLSVKVAAQISYRGTVISDDVFSVTKREETRRIRVSDTEGHVHHWGPGHPNLYDVEFRVEVGGKVVDTVKSYFGMRKVSVVDGRFCLNNHPYFLKMVLDQGYFPEGILTAPTDEALKNDVELTKAMGFNGARKHQKIEDPRWLYWCDQLGLIVWSEMANAYAYSEEYVRKMALEFPAAIERDYNHPCIAAWVPINESWGVPNITFDKQQQDHAMAMYYTAHSLDGTRPVISNDGWEHVKSDLCTIHDYWWQREILEDRYSTREKAVAGRPANKWIFAQGYHYENQPIIVSEFGGISFKKSEWEGWGYSGAENDADFVERLANVFQPLLNTPSVQGYCYTQLTDVEQEINGLLTYDRVPKVPLEWIRQINEGKRPNLD